MKKKRRFGRRVFCVLIVLFMGVIWQSDLLSQEPAEVRSLRTGDSADRWQLQGILFWIADRR